MNEEDLVSKLTTLEKVISNYTTLLSQDLAGECRVRITNLLEDAHKAFIKLL